MSFDPITAIADLANTALGSYTDGLKHKREIAAAEAANKARLLLDTNSNNHAWEMANLTDKDGPLRRACFAVFMFPFFWAIFDPAGVTNYFTVVMNAMPEWYIQLVLAMVGGIWGIASLKNVIPSITSQIVNAVRKSN